MKKYINFHSHTSDSNVFSKDSAVLFRDYLDRVRELGLEAISTVEHGWQSSYFTKYAELEDYNKKYGTNIKFIFGTEAYFVKDRFAKIDKDTLDGTNAHLIILAKNDKGRKAINKALSLANKSGFYKRPRLDFELLDMLPAEDVFITTACIAGIWKYTDYEDILLTLHHKFKDNLYLEVQYHNTDKQKQLNKLILELSQKYNIPIIAGMDSHHVDENDAWERDELLKSYNITYEDEEGWYLDFPDYNTAVNRFVEQGVLTSSQIQEAMDNTNVIMDFEDIILDISLKVPTLYPNKTQDERNKTLTTLLTREYRAMEHSIAPETRQHYIQEIKREVDEIIGCDMSDYFLLNYYVIKKGKEKGGILTRTGRGSASSSYINKLLGFTQIDRITNPIPLFPERFLTKERILASHQTPDIDFNIANPKPFVEAQRELLGEMSTYPLLALGKLKLKSAFKMYARANDVEPNVANEVSKQIAAYEKAAYHNNNDDVEIDVYDYVNKEKFGYIIEGCQEYLGITVDRKPHPCGHTCSSLDVEEEIGLVLCKSESTKNEALVAVLESSQIDKFGWLKNDFLTVSVVSNSQLVYNRIGIEPLTIQELIQVTQNDKKTWDIYAKGLTLCVNQVEQEATRKKVMAYKPTNYVEASYFVASIRPSFASMYKVFESRQPFSYGIKTLDNLLQTKYMPYSFIVFQEHLMLIMAYAGMEAGETYDVIKAISKKKVKVILAAKEKFIKGFGAKVKEDEAKDGHFLNDEEINNICSKVWTIIEDNAAYGFNSSHALCVALDSLDGAYLKAHYPYEFYETMLKVYTEKAEKDKVTALKHEMKHFGIKIGNLKFGEDNRDFRAFKQQGIITQSLKSIKGLNQAVANTIYSIAKTRNCKTFIDVLVAINETKEINSGQLNTLIELDYFSDFGDVNKLKAIVDIFNDYYGKKQFTQANLSDKINSIIRKHTKKITNKLYKDVDVLAVINELILDIPENLETISDIVRRQYTLLGDVSITNSAFPKTVQVVLDIDTTYSPKITLYGLQTGKITVLKCNKKYFKYLPLNPFDIINIKKTEKRKKGSYINNVWTPSDNEFEFWITEYTKITL